MYLFSWEFGELEEFLYLFGIFSRSIITKNDYRYKVGARMTKELIVKSGLRELFMTKEGDELSKVNQTD